MSNIYQNKKNYKLGVTNNQGKTTSIPLLKNYKLGLTNGQVKNMSIMLLKKELRLCPRYHQVWMRRRRTMPITSFLKSSIPKKYIDSHYIHVVSWSVVRNKTDKQR